MWPGWAAGEAVGTLALHARYQTWPPRPYLWRLGTPLTDRFGGFLGIADGLMTEPGSVAFHSRTRDPFHAWRWAVYFLPRREVVQADLARLDDYAYVIGWQAPLEHPRLDPVLEAGDGMLYLVRRE